MLYSLSSGAGYDMHLKAALIRQKLLIFGSLQVYGNYLEKRRMGLCKETRSINAVS
jgi:hypothetical protein